MAFNYSQITDTLFIGTTPREADYPVLRAHDVRLIINMRVERRPFPDPHATPIPVLWLPTFDTPLIPVPLNTLLRGASAAVASLAQGGKVYIHCAQGMHRGVAMGAAILIAQGYKAAEAIAMIKERRSVADPDIWYIRRQIFRFEKVWGKERRPARSSHD